jgi:hypothetical protein
VAVLTPDEALGLVDALHDTIRKRRDDIDKFDRYYRGDQPLLMASESWRRYHGERYKHFSDNWTAVVADATAQRLKVSGFSFDGETDVSSAERSMWDDWRRNDMDAQSSQGFLESIKSRRSYVLVWSSDSDGTPLMTWEDPSQVAVMYDPERPRVRKAALKCWVDGDMEYATLYAADFIYKYERKVSKFANRESDARFWLPAGVITNGWEPRGGDEPWPVVNPLGEVPIVEFPNRPLLRGEPLSDVGGVVPMQDAINLMWAYLFAGADHASFPARVVLGMEAPSVPVLDTNGQDTGKRMPVDLNSLAQGRMLFLNQEGRDPKVAQWDSAKLDVFTNVVETAVGHVAAQTRTPQHYLILGRNANPPSADALKASEAGLVAKVGEAQLFFTAAVREVFRLAALVRGDAGVADRARLARVLWQDAENRSDAQKADAATKWFSSGVPLQALLERYWTSDPTEVERIMAMREAEMDDPTMQRIMRDLKSVPGAPSPSQVTTGEPAEQ